MRHWLLIFAIIFGCLGYGQSADSSMLYINEQGQLNLVKVSDSLWHCEFKTLDGYQYDTTLRVSSNLNMQAYRQNDELFFLEYNWGGLSVSKNKVTILEFTSFGRLAYQSGMSQIYTLPFIRSGEKITLEGDLRSSKGNATIDGIFLDPNPKVEPKFYRINGVVVREPFPRSFYSTSDSPQGMFKDTTKTYYRLVFKKYTIEEPELTTYKGLAINNSNGLPCIVWEMADSEAFILDRKKPWTKEEQGKPIVVKGYLTQELLGSTLKNWEIVDGH